MSDNEDRTETQIRDLLDQIRHDLAVVRSVTEGASAATLDRLAVAERELAEVAGLAAERGIEP